MKRGAGWEARLLAWHQEYRVKGLAWVVKTDPPRNLRAVGPPDFLGVLKGGRAVCFDAKDCTSSRFNLGKIVAHQRADLDTAHRMGALSFVALRIGGVGYRVPWEVISAEIKRGVKSFTIRDIERISVPMGRDGWL